MNEELRKQKQRRVVKITLIGSVVDTLLGIAKIAVGYLFHSHALVVDGIHSFSDLGTDAVVLLLGKVSHEAPDKNHPYGHEKFETIGSAALGSILIGTAGALIYDTIQNLYSGSVTEPLGWPTIIVAVISIISKEIIFQVSYKMGEEMKSKLLMANAWHSRTDAISSIVVLIGLIFGMYGLRYFDDLAALVVSIMIAKVGWMFVKESLVELTDTSVNREMGKQIKDLILATEGVQHCHALRTRRMGPKVLVDVNIEVNSKLSASEGHEICSWVSRNLKTKFEEIEDVTVHLDIEDDRIYGDQNNPYIHEYKNLLPLRNEVVQELKNQWKSYLDLDKAIEIRLHYINRKIDIELLLNNKRDIDFKELQSKLNESKIEWLGEVRIVLSLDS